MIQSLVLVEGKDVTKASLGVSLSNAKQIVLKQMVGGDWILHVAATTLADLDKALLKFAKITGVTGVVTLLIRP